jgi:carbonic anhydrase
MSYYEQVLEANRRYAESFDRSKLAMPPSKRLVVVACMDARLTVEELLGLKTGEAHIIRNAGGLVTDDALRSLIISYKLLGTREFFVINHSDCGMLTFTDEQLRQQLTKDTGADAGSLAFYAFNNLEENVRAQVAQIRNSPFIPKDISVRGFVYQVENGLLKEVT